MRRTVARVSFHDHCTHAPVAREHRLRQKRPISEATNAFWHSFLFAFSRRVYFSAVLTGTGCWGSLGCASKTSSHLCSDLAKGTDLGTYHPCSPQPYTFDCLGRLYVASKTSSLRSLHSVHLPEEASPFCV